eukprot:TRINITY_DN26044_c0_g1_i1.p1 TRINITY_DN26044_c0_g1~~TRINITY_DN26044_c0_g1_i1.p1  ORF type:complete len:1115 (+),score=239.31 TRINITY_DN26044_c0_g1_i1:70-3414(+)
MAPKKKEAVAEVVETGPDEEEELGPGKVGISFAISGVRGLPCELETIVAFTGFCKENRSNPAAASAEPSGWELPKDKVIRLQNQDLYNDLVARPLTITLRDAGADNAVIGRTELDLLPLLHESREISTELELKLTEEYHARWWPTAEDDAPAKPAKGKDKKGATPTPEPPKTPLKPKFEGDAPPTTIIAVTISVEELVGPVEDRDCWTTMRLDVKGVFALPEQLSSLGVANPEDVSGHLLKYSGEVLGESLGDGVLTKAPEVPEDADEPEGMEEAEWRSRQERYKPFVGFSAGKTIRYRGRAFVEQLQEMLNKTGGVWLYFSPEEKGPPDPKKPSPPELVETVRTCTGKVWLDLRKLILPGEKHLDICAAIEPSPEVVQEAGEAGTLLGNARTYARLALELSMDVTPGEPEEYQIPLKTLLPVRTNCNKFTSSAGVATMYHEAVERTYRAVCSDCADGLQGGGVKEAVTQLKEVGSYDELKDSLRGAVVRVFRERLRKDTFAVPGKPLRGKARDEFIANTYAYLRQSASKVMDELRGEVLPQGGPATPAAEHGPDQPESGGRMKRPQEPPQGSKSPPVGAMVEEPAGPDAITASELSMVALLAESAAARNAREALGVATNESLRCSRLAYEAELVNAWDRAATLLQNRFLIEGLNLRKDPCEWVAFAKFCGRSRGRQAAAEEALRQAVQLMAEGAQADEEMAMEVDLFLACLLLDRGRHEEAIEVFQSWHEKDFANATFRFLLGLALFLRCRFEEAKPYLESVGKPREWFNGLPDQEAVVNKLRAFRGTDGPLDVAAYASILNKLLSFGLPSLVFTFLDQTQTLPKEALDSELLVLIDAKASGLDRDFHAAVARLEPLLSSGKASREAYRLAGESYLQLQDFDRALQNLQTALSVEHKFEDPAVYIRLGSVLLVKKRWKQAREAFLRSIQSQATAEAWSGVGYAEFRADELQTCYEALCEANVLDNDRADVWAQLSLVHLRMETWDAADHACRQCLSLEPDCEELLLEVASEYHRRERQPSLSEACARRALAIRDSGQGHSVLADVLAQAGQAERSVLEAQIALKLLADQPELRKAIFGKALKLCAELGDAPLTESLHAVQKLADEQHSSPGIR